MTWMTKFPEDIVVHFLNYYDASQTIYCEMKLSEKYKKSLINLSLLWNTDSTNLKFKTYSLS